MVSGSSSSEKASPSKLLASYRRLYNACSNNGGHNGGYEALLLSGIPTPDELEGGGGGMAQMMGINTKGERPLNEEREKSDCH